jgi:hypothetical protein
VPLVKTKPPALPEPLGYYMRPWWVGTARDCGDCELLGGEELPAIIRPRGTAAGVARTPCTSPCRPARSPPYLNRGRVFIRALMAG